MFLRFLYYKINVCSCIKFKYFGKVKRGSESPLSNLPSEVAIVSIVSRYPPSFSMSLPLSLQLFVSPLIQNIDTHIHILHTYTYNFIFFIYIYIYIHIPLYTCISSVQFSHSVVSISATPQTAARQASLSSLTPGIYSKSCPSCQWCHPTISSSVIPFSSRLQSLPAKVHLVKAMVFPVVMYGC